MKGSPKEDEEGSEGSHHCHHHHEDEAAKLKAEMAAKKALLFENEADYLKYELKEAYDRINKSRKDYTKDLNILRD